MTSNLSMDKGDNGGSKMMIGHIAIEVLLLSGLSYYFNTRLAALKTENDELKKEVELLKQKIDIIEENGGGATVLTEQQLTEFKSFQQNTIQHLNILYGYIDQERKLRAQSQPQPQPPQPQLPQPSQPQPQLRSQTSQAKTQISQSKQKQQIQPQKSQINQKTQKPQLNRHKNSPDIPKPQIKLIPQGIILPQQSPIGVGMMTTSLSGLTRSPSTTRFQ